MKRGLIVLFVFAVVLSSVTVLGQTKIEISPGTVGSIGQTSPTTFDISGCRSIVSSAEKQECIKEIKNDYSGGASLCSVIDNLNIRDECIFKVEVSNAKYLNFDTCSRLNGNLYKAICLAVVAGKQKNSDICSPIKTRGNLELCLDKNIDSEFISKSQLSSKNNLYFMNENDLKMINRGENICIQTPSRGINSLCYSFVAMASKDATPCLNIKSSTDKDRCLYMAAASSLNLNACKMMSNGFFGFFGNSKRKECIATISNAQNAIFQAKIKQLLSQQNSLTDFLTA